MINSALEDIENQLEEQPKSVRIAIYISLFLSILWFVWSIEYSSQFEQYQKQSLKIEKAKKKITHYYPRRYIIRLHKLKKSLKNLEKESHKLEDTLATIENNAKNYRYLWFDNRQFIALIEAIMRRSLELNLEIDKVIKVNIKKDEEVKLKGELPKLIPQKNLYIKGVGRFDKIVRLVYFIDSFNFLLESQKIEMIKGKSSDSINFLISFKLYGLKK